MAKLIQKANVDFHAGRKGEAFLTAMVAIELLSKGIARNMLDIEELKKERSKGGTA